MGGGEGGILCLGPRAWLAVPRTLLNSQTAPESQEFQQRDSAEYVKHEQDTYTIFYVSLYAFLIE